ncbi:MFS transporter, partial [Streptomyces sp. SID5926]|nr:MFS transporter [Streptomyces sp. SID5926]
LAGSSATGLLLDTGLPVAVPWLMLAAVPLVAAATLPRWPHRGAGAAAPTRSTAGSVRS